MKSLDPLKASSYDYHLPAELIAKEPVEPADSAKLLVYDRSTDRISHHIFWELPDLLPKDTHLIFNDTKVIKARLFGYKESGGKIELLLNRPFNDGLFNVLIRGRVRKGNRLHFDEGLVTEVIELNEDGSRIVRFFKDGKPIGFEELITLLERIGHVPLPPYIDREDRPEDARYYQPLMAQKPGAVAAPTASLHFTPELLEKIRSRFATHTITLHVGAGTFKPVEVETITHHPMHSEYYQIPPDTCATIDSEAKILAVGTTVTRTIEHYVRTGRCSGECDLFLHPLNPPRRVDHLLTNFHLPRSTLIMLVAAFLGVKKTLELYKIAIKNRYRFYSYGDAMLIL